MLLDAGMPGATLSCDVMPTHGFSCHNVLQKKNKKKTSRSVDNEEL